MPLFSIIIPWRSVGDPYRDASFHYILSEQTKMWPGYQIIVANNEGPFNRAAARNKGAVEAEEEILVFLDADSWISNKNMGVGASVAKSDSGWCLPYSYYLNLTDEASRFWMTQDWQGREEPFPCEDEYEYIFPGPDPVDRPASVGGCICVTREAFEAVGGYDERFHGWGLEDRAFALALETLVGPEERLRGSLYHLWHPASEEVRFGNPHFPANQRLFLRYQTAAGFPEAMRQVTG